MLHNSSAGVYILISVTAFIAKTTWEQRFLSFKSAEMSRYRRNLLKFTSSQSHEYIIQMTLRSINSNFAECYCPTYKLFSSLAFTCVLQSLYRERGPSQSTDSHRLICLATPPSQKLVQLLQWLHGDHWARITVRNS
jgi:hypothetical protein